MATPLAQASINTFIQVSDGNSPEAFVTIPNVSSITGPTFQAQVVDVTSHSTGVPWRQKITTLLDPGTVSWDTYFIPNDATHQRLLAIFANRGLPTAPQALSDWRISFPTVPARTVWSISAWLSKFNISAPVDGVIKGATEIVLSGEPSIPGVTA